MGGILVVSYWSLGCVRCAHSNSEALCGLLDGREWGGSCGECLLASLFVLGSNTLLGWASDVSVNDVALKLHSALASANSVSRRGFAAVSHLVCARLSVAPVVIELVSLSQSCGHCAQSRGLEDSSAQGRGSLNFSRGRNLNGFAFLGLREDRRSLNNCSVGGVSSAGEKEGECAYFDKLFHCVVWVILMIPCMSCSLNTIFVTNKSNFKSSSSLRNLLV